MKYNVIYLSLVLIDYYIFKSIVFQSKITNKLNTITGSNLAQ